MHCCWQLAGRLPALALPAVGDASPRRRLPRQPTHPRAPSALSQKLYVHSRWAVNAAVRLGMAALPAAVLHAAYGASAAPAPGTPLAALAWRALLTSRAFILLVTSCSRRARLLPQVLAAGCSPLAACKERGVGWGACSMTAAAAGCPQQAGPLSVERPRPPRPQLGLSLAALALARSYAPAACATPLLRDPQVEPGELLGWRVCLARCCPPQARLHLPFARQGLRLDFCGPDLTSRTRPHSSECPPHPTHVHPSTHRWARS